MKSTWFHHTDCSTEQADELVKRYKARGVRVERSLNQDSPAASLLVSMEEEANLQADKLQHWPDIMLD
ncbi:hypothetical protein ACAD16_001063 [Enterobacter asburiae]